MTPDVHAALGRVIAFLDAFEDEAYPQGAISTLRSEGLRLEAKDLRTLLDVVDPTPTIEWGVRFRFDQVGETDVPYKTEEGARAAVPSSAAHSLLHRFVVRRPDDVSAWIEGEPAAEPTRHAPLTDDTSGAHITPAGRAAVLDYKAIRREQNPRPRLGGGPS